MGQEPPSAPATPQQSPRDSFPKGEAGRRIDSTQLRVNLSAITVDGIPVKVRVHDGSRYVAMDSKLLRSVLGVSATPEDCILNDIREYLLGKRGKTRRNLGSLVDKSGMPLEASLTYNARGKDITVLPKSWPIYVAADDFEHLLHAVKDDAEARQRENRRPG